MVFSPSPHFSSVNEDDSAVLLSERGKTDGWQKQKCTVRPEKIVFRSGNGWNDHGFTGFSYSIYCLSVVCTADRQYLHRRKSNTFCIPESA